MLDQMWLEVHLELSRQGIELSATPGGTLSPASAHGGPRNPVMAPRTVLFCVCSRGPPALSEQAEVIDGPTPRFLRGKELPLGGLPLEGSFR